MIYRAVVNPSSLEVKSQNTQRAPGNIPYFVDNIWEWLRPVDYPSRRFSAFASPNAQIAADAINCSLDNVYSVEMILPGKACQIVEAPEPVDAKFHPDVRRLKDLIIKTLPRDWFDRPLAERLNLAALFLPCTSREEINDLFSGTTPFDVPKICNTVSLWRDVKLFNPLSEDAKLHPRGEIFFEGSYRLKALEKDVF